MGASSLNDTLDLIRRAQAGEDEALGVLFEKYYSPVRSYVRRRLGPELRQEADSVDIMQETFLCAVQYFDRFEVRDNANLVNWLSRIAESAIRTLARRAFADKRDRRRQKRLAVLRDSISKGDIKIDPVAEITLPGEALERKDQRERLSAALDELEPKHREVILHRTYAKATWRQVMELMELESESTARLLHSRAIAALVSLMGPE